MTLTAGQRVLLTGQTTASQNGIWVVQSGSWTRPTDYASGSTQVGAFVFVEGGTNNATSGWVLTGTSAVTVDTTSQNWTQFSGAGEITAGTGLTKTGNTLSVQFGTTGGTAAQGNDSRITGAEQTANKGAASGYTPLDSTSKVPIANLPTGTTSSTVAVGNDSRITGALQSSNNFSDVANAATARTNLGLGTLATKNSVNLATDAGSSILPVANGGTGSSTQNFVDLSSAQSSIGGTKTFTATVSGQTGFSVTNGGALLGAAAGIDNAFNILRLYSNLANSDIQIVSSGGVTHFYNGGNDVMDITSSYVAINDGYSLVAGSTNGLKIGTSTSQKLGFYNTTPVVQPNTTGTTGGFTANSGTAMNSASTSTGNTGTTAYTFGDVVNALKKLGLLAA